MQHDDAIGSMASEKYLLNELTPELREEFEEHFFGCQDCALEVRAGAALLEHSKSVLSAPRRREVQAAGSAKHTQGWGAWLRPAFVVPVLALLLAVIGFQSFVTSSRLKSADFGSPRILPSASLISARGDKVPLIAVRPNESFLLFVDIPAESRFSSYICELYSPAGGLEWSIPVSAEAAKNTLSLQVPARRGIPGTYSLVVSGVASGQNSVLARYSFELQAQK